MSSHIWLCLLAVFSLCIEKIESQEPKWICGSEFELGIENGHSFSSPGFPGPYPAGLQCRWKVSSPENTIINLHCPQLHVEESMIGCLDLFYVAGHSEKENGYNTPICGLKTVNITTTNNYIDVYFSSFGSLNVSHKTAQGFKCVMIVHEKNTQKEHVISHCGMKSLNSRIVNGSEAELHAWPWQVALLTLKPIPHEVKQHHHHQFCGGSLISSNWVLTAAHCVEDKTKDDVLVILGEHDLDTGLETNHTEERNVRDIIVHSGYMKSWGNIAINDIALLQLSQPVEYSHGVMPVCLPANFYNSLFDGEISIATGWGKVSGVGDTSNDLLEITYPIITNSECADMFGVDIYNDQICAYEEGKSACNGDSGGPLVLQDEDHQYYQIGIASWASIQCKEYPTVYTRVTSYIDWIEEKTATRFIYNHDAHNEPMTQINAITPTTSTLTANTAASTTATTTTTSATTTILSECQEGDFTVNETANGCFTCFCVGRTWDCAMEEC